ncbi:hypothetical protein ACIRLA_22320 [Streptomyces sp. NPDC102364]|uniref:hypothetical protein n=1 Tax=Streptomyces sp. NPDC102364 TaxID=3366161 RepID=UPI003808876D
MSLDIAALDTPAAQVEANARVLTLAAAEARTHSPSDALAFRLDEWLVTHPDVVTVDAPAGWDHRIKQIAKLNELHRKVAEFNRLHPVGTPVSAYPGCRPEFDSNCTRLDTVTRSRAEVLSGHTAVVWVDGESSCIQLSHIDIRTGGAK